MRFMILRKADQHTEAGEMPSEDLIMAMGQYNERLIDAGVMVSGDGLKPSREGYRITFKNGEPIVTDGPFAETKELLAGFTMIEVDSKEEALNWVKQWPPQDGEGEVILELRPVFGLEDFQPGPAIDKMKGHAERLSKQPDGMAVHLSFNGNCREAFDFYADCLGGVVETRFTHGEAPPSEHIPADWSDKIMHSTLNLSGKIIMGADTPADFYQAPQGFYVQLSIDDLDKATQAFNRLAEGGQIVMPFEETFWANGFGMAKDRFGIPWMINSGMK